MEATQKEMSRSEIKRRKREEERRRKQQQRMLRTGGIILAAVVVIGLLGYFIWKSSQVEAAQPGTPVADEGRAHIPSSQPTQYQHYPPASGPHYDTPANWGVYDTPIPDGTWVHNLEHGGVVIVYKCPSGCPDIAKQLKDFAATVPRSSKWNEVKLVVTPYNTDKWQGKIAVVAWDWVEEMDTVDTGKLMAFYKAHVDQGPEDVP